MKKTIILLALVMSLPILAQDKLPDFPNPKVDIDKHFILKKHAKHEAQRFSSVLSAPQAGVAQANQVAEDAYIGYLQPEGTLFLGMDESGKGTFLSTSSSGFRSGVIGGWSDTLACWVWRNQIADYDSISYLTYFGKQYPSYVEKEYYGVDAYGNFCDSMVARGGMYPGYNGDEGYAWQNSVPYQTILSGGSSYPHNFMILQSPGSSSILNSCTSVVAGGLPSGSTSDGLWPLTNAVPFGTEGLSSTLIASTDEDEYVHYLFGSDSLNVDTIDEASYTRIAPVELITEYDQPQTPLYIHNITLAVGANGYSAFKQDTLKVGTLSLQILDMEGNELASATATNDNLSSMTAFKGKILTFDFETLSPYGEILSEGIKIDEAFQIVLSGFSGESHFGIYAAQSALTDSRSTMVYEGDSSVVIDYDPYIMLNGIYPTFEDLRVSYMRDNYGATFVNGMHGDTLPIKMVYSPTTHYQYIGAYGDSKLIERGFEYDADYQNFWFVSTFEPYEVQTHMWNFSIIRPDYIQLGADFEEVVDEESGETIWDYMRMFYLWIYATDTPVEGDCITLEKYGARIVFEIIEVSDPTGVEDAEWNKDQGQVKKVLEHGQLRIIKGNKQYSIYGQAIE